MHSTTTTTFFIIVVSVAISTCYSQDDDKYTTCARNFSCGQIQNVGYPFWGDGRPQDCGHPSFELKCRNNESLTIDIDNRTFRVDVIDQFSQTITIVSLDLWETQCTRELHNVTLDNSLLRYGPMNEDLFIFYNCTSETTVFLHYFTCGTGGIEGGGYYTDESFFHRIENLTCTQSLKVPMFGVMKFEILNGSLPLERGLRSGFEVVYDAFYMANCSQCKVSGGICGSNSSGFVCHCSDGTEHMTCQKRGTQPL